MASRSRSVGSNQAPTPPVRLDPQAIISDSATLVGIYPIDIGAHAVLHPRCRLNSTYAPVTIGEGCIVNEACHVGLREEPDFSTRDEDVRVELGANVMLEPGAIIEARLLDDGCIIEARATVGKGCILGKNCRVAPLCHVRDLQHLPESTIVFGNNQLRKEKPGLESYRAIIHQKQLDILRRLIPSNLAKWQSSDK